MIAPKKILWNGFNSIEMSCKTDLAFDADNGETESYLNKTAISSDNYDGSARKVHAYKYSDVLRAGITFIREDMVPFTSEENRIMLSWLTSKKTTGVLSVYYENEDSADYELIGNFIEVAQQKTTNGQVVGYVCTFECISPYAYSPVRIESYDVDKSASFVIRCNNDELHDCIYPKITIQPTVNTNIVIANESIVTTVKTSDGAQIVPTTTTINNNMENETIVIDGANRIIYSSKADRIFGDNFSWDSWMPLVLGPNVITVTGSCTITFEWREPRKIGSL